jgi:hypothetical protein
VASWTFITERICAVDLRLDVVALVEHERDACFGSQRVRQHDLVHDPEQLEWVRGTDHEVVVGIEAAVEVEGAELPGAQQERDDEFDVGARGVVAGVDDDDGLWSELDAVRIRRSPIRHVHDVERRLEQLVLQQDALVVSQPVVRFPQRLGQAVLSGPQVVLRRVVQPVGEPQLDVA